MNTLNFNIYAFVKPASKEEYLALLDEAIRMARELTDMLHVVPAPTTKAEYLALLDEGIRLARELNTMLDRVITPLPPPN